MYNSSIRNDSCVLVSVIDFITKYVMNIVSIFGIIANLICIMIFIKIIKTTQLRGNMYKYLLMKSIMDFLTLIINSFQYLKYCSNCETAHSYLMQIWFIWFYFYFSFIVETSSALFEMAAIFDCYITIKSVLKFCQTNLFFYFFCIVVIVVNVIINIFFPLSFQIESRINNQNETVFDHGFSDFGKSSFSNVLFFNSIVKDGLFFIVLFILNVMILTLLKKTTDRKRSLAGNSNTLLSTSQLAERKKLIMIIATSSNYIIGHFSYFTWTVISTFNREKYDSCYSTFSLLFYYTTFADSLFFYFLFNNIFKKVLIQSIPFINRNTF
jgi:hypothetical protein